ncbi:MAG TPA: CinA family nicotinamide mononucleotide deamidase-related protein [Acidimicrobiia bacterium]|nr:CinA family nicotinamide mononucleotide deamidase-related protein [Acidimicrobiia bacterium]
MGAGKLIVEVISVGTELLIGQIANTNAAFIGARLAEEGFDAHFQVTVGDNLDRLISAIGEGLARADVIVLTGGIGPTQDDLTREAMAQVAGRSMVRDPEHAAWIESRVRNQSGSVNPSVLRMADLPEGAEGLPNTNGVALGVALKHEGKWLLAVPGVPVEMRAMVDGEVIPRLRRMSGEMSILRSRLLRTWGVGESRIAEALDDLFESANPTVAFLISDMEVKIRISAKAADAASAAELIAPVEQKIRDTLGEAVFAADDETVENIVVERLAARGWTVATREEATLGQVGSRIAISGAELFAGAVIGAGRPPPADVILTVGPIGPDLDEGPRTTRRVEMELTTPAGETTRVFDLGGDDERVRSFATIAALHVIRLALETAR